MGTSTRFSFRPKEVKGNMDGASQVLPTGSGQMLMYEILDGYQASGGQECIGVIAYDFVNARWSCLFSRNGVLSTHQNTTWVDDKGEIVAFMATLVSPPVPLTDEVGDDVPWPASFPPMIAS